MLSFLTLYDQYGNLTEFGIMGFSYEKWGKDMGS